MVSTASKLRQTLAQERQDLDRLIHDSEGKALLATFDQSLARYETFQRQIIDLALKGVRTKRLHSPVVSSTSTRA